MSMESTAWNAMYTAMRAQTEQRPLNVGTLRRIGGFAAPHRRRLIWFALISIVVAVLTVATPLLAGRVIDAITRGATASVVVGLAVVIAVVAVVEAGLGLWQRRLSATIEELIYDLRTAVYDHVQTMPVAFFNRTRTGALVNRLNNDVIGAQRTFSDTFAGIINNTVTLLLALIAMLALSWQITVGALLLLPVFLLPARRIGARLASLQREKAAHNAAMGNRMTERFSAPGATLIKLFGRPARESAEFAARAGLVRDIGVRSAVVQETFYLALMLVSALALALIYGLGGVYALRGEIEAGTVVALAMLLTPPVCAAHRAGQHPVELMSAMVSFERVFEVLDLQPLIADRDDARPVPSGPLDVEFDGVAALSRRRPRLAGVAGSCGARPAGGKRGSPRHLLPRAGRADGRAGRRSGAGKSTIASLVPRLYDVDGGAVLLGGADIARTRRAVAAQCCRRSWSPRTAICSMTPCGPTSPWAFPTPPTLCCGTRCTAPGSTASSPTCPTASTPSSANAATGSPAVSGNA